jgi:hypothetical protein
MTGIAGSGSTSQRHGSTDPDPYQNVMDPQHCILQKQSEQNLTDKHELLNIGDHLWRLGKFSFDVPVNII